MIRTGKKKLFLILLILLSIIVLWFSAPLWLKKIGSFSISNETLQKADIIIVLSGDDEGQRLRHAFNLYQRGYAGEILLSGATNLWEETGVDLMEKYLIQLGVPQKDILSEKRSESTVENAIFSKHLLQDRSLKSAIVVTSPTHSRRVSLIFKRVFSPSYRVSVSSDPEAFKPEGWWRDPSLRRTVIREYFQMCWYLLLED